MYGRIGIMCRLHIGSSWVSWLMCGSMEGDRPIEDVPNETSVGDPIIWVIYIGVAD